MIGSNTTFKAMVYYLGHYLGSLNVLEAIKKHGIILESVLNRIFKTYLLLVCTGGYNSRYYDFNKILINLSK